MNKISGLFPFACLASGMTLFFVPNAAQDQIAHVLIILSVVLWVLDRLFTK